MRALSAPMVFYVLAVATPAAGGPDPGAPDLLRRMAGTWDATLQMASPDDNPPLVMNGTEIATLGGEGAWLVSDFRSQLEGRPFQGHGILTRDPRTGRYRRVWADASSPAFWSSEGTYDGATGSLTLWIETTDSAGRPVRWREVLTWKDDDTRTFTMYVPGPESREAAGMAIVYRRRKDPGAGRSPAAGPPLSPAPGPEHAIVARDAGAWKATVDNRMDPARPTDDSKATETGALCCGGMFLVTDFTGKERDRPFSGHGLLGYDPQKKKFVRAWIDTGDRALSLSEGDYDAARETLTLQVPQPDDHGGTVILREVLEWKGSDQRLLRLFVPGPEGQETPGLTIKYRRAKD